MDKLGSIYRVISTVFDFFKDERAHSFYIAVWRRDKNDPSIVDFRFSCEVIERSAKVLCPREYQLIENEPFNKAFMKSYNVYDLSKNINKRIGLTKLENDVIKHFNLFNGVCFKKDDYEQLLAKVFGDISVASFKSIEMMESLSKNLPYKEEKETRGKI